MKRVRTNDELKGAIKEKQDVILIVGELADSIRKDITDYEKNKNKNAINKVSKGAAWFSFLFLPLSPIPVAILGAGILGSLLTKDDFKKYDVTIPEGTYIKLTRKKGLFN